MKVQMGEKYRDEPTGYEGVVTGRFEYLNGCVRYLLEKLDKDGKPQDAVFDEERLVAVSDGKPPTATGRSGGPHPTPTRARTG